VNKKELDDFYTLYYDIFSVNHFPSTIETTFRYVLTNSQGEDNF